MKKLSLALLALVLAACGGSPTPSISSDGTLAPYYAQELNWRACDNSLECAEILVPMDYADVTGGDVTISVARHKATKTAKTVIFLNPGGPGGSGVDYLGYWKDQFSKNMYENADLVSWDPRGVQRSAPVDCFTDKQLDEFSKEDPTPDTAAEVTDFWANSDAELQQCVDNTGKVLSHVSTVETAKDLDILRAIFKQTKLNYLGKSYGTQLGSVYAKLFPENVGKFVLDGAVDADLSTKQMSMDQAEAFDIAIQRMARYCLENYQPCGLGKSVTQITSKITAFINQVDQKPLKTDNPDRPLYETNAWNAVIMPMYVNAGGWDWLIQALESAYDGNGSDMLSISDWATSRNPNGTYADNSTEAFLAISCLDTGSTTNKDISSIIPEFEAVAPITGRMLAWSETMCVDWPVSGILAPTDVKTDVETPIVVIGTTYDPATPLKWAKSLTKQLGDAVFIQFNGDGHTAYFSGSSCMDNIVEDFYFNGTQPTANTVCQPDSPLLD